MYKKLKIALYVALVCGLFFAVGASAKTYIFGDDGTWTTPDTASFRFTSSDRVSFQLAERAKVTITLTFSPYGTKGALIEPDTIPGTTKWVTMETKNVYTTTSFLDPGTYYTGYYFDSYGDSSGRKMKFALTIVPVTGLTDINNNHSLDNALPITTSFKVSGMVGAYGNCNDYYKLTLSKPTKISLTFTSRDSDINLKLYRQGNTSSFFSFLENWYEDVPNGIYLNQSVLSKPETYKYSFTLPAGEIYFAICESKYGGRYDLKLKNLGSSAGVFKMPSTKTVTAGFSSTILAEIKPSYFDQPGDVVYTISAKSTKYATLDPNTGLIRALSPGKVTVKARSDKLNKTLKCTLTVAKNEYKRSKPWYKKGRKVFLSVKRIAYSGNNVIVDVYVYNRTGRTLRSLYGLGVELYSSDADGVQTGDEEWTEEIDVWKPKGGSLRSGRYAVVRFRFEEMPKDKYDIRARLLRADVGAYYAKKIRKVTPQLVFVEEGAPGALSGLYALPEETYRADAASDQ